MIEPELRFWAGARKASISRIENLAQTQLDYSPSDGGWSIGEIIDHVLKTERLYRGEFEALIRLDKSGRRPLIRRGFGEIDVGIPFLPSSVMPMVGSALGLINPFIPQGVRNRIIRSRSLKASSPRALLPARGRGLEELLAELKSQFERTRGVFDENPGLDYTRMIHQHPMIGINTLPQLVRIAALHEERHQEQVDQILADPGFPRSESPTSTPA